MLQDAAVLQQQFSLFPLWQHPIFCDLGWRQFADEVLVAHNTAEEPMNMRISRRGERVYLRRKTVGGKQDNIKPKRSSTKLDCIRLGPFEVEEKLEYDNYKLKLPNRMKIHPIFHIHIPIDKNEESNDSRRHRSIRH
jgi:hypothetical protein